MLSRYLTLSSHGLFAGIASMTVPVYIAEVSPPNLRGRLVTINTLFITGGQFFASVVDGAFSYLQKDGWRSVHSAYISFANESLILEDGKRAVRGKILPGDFTSL